jgi:hypothetical protein
VPVLLSSKFIVMTGPLGAPKPGVWGIGVGRSVEGPIGSVVSERRRAGAGISSGVGGRGSVPSSTNCGRDSCGARSVI